MFLERWLIGAALVVGFVVSYKFLCNGMSSQKQGSEESGDRKRTDQAPEGSNPSGLTHQSGDLKRTDQAPEGGNPSGLTHRDLLAVFAQEAGRHGLLLQMLIASVGGRGLQHRLYVDRMGFHEPSRTLNLVNIRREYDADAIEQLRIAAAVYRKIGQAVEASEEIKAEPFNIACYLAVVQTPNLPNTSALQDCVEQFYSAAGCELEIMVFSPDADTRTFAPDAETDVFAPDEDALIHTVRRAGMS